MHLAIEERFYNRFIGIAPMVFWQSSIMVALRIVKRSTTLMGQGNRRGCWTFF